jgi:protein phosphatase
MRDLEELTKKVILTISETQRKHLEISGKMVTLPRNTRAIIIGDIHGDLNTLHQILSINRWHQKTIEEKPVLIFLGDYIDRGPKQIQVLELIFNLLIKNPSRVILLRGNHEGPRDLPVSPHDFPKHLQKKYGNNWRDAYNYYQEIFENLYTSVLIEKKALLVHGGIPTKAQGLNDIINAHKTHPGTTTLMEILWNDPSTIPGIHYSYRGIGKLFGEDITLNFLDQIGVKYLIRGHECFNQGYHWHNNRTLTVFSCKIPIYRNTHAAFVKYNQDIKVQKL